MSLKRILYKAIFIFIGQGFQTPGSNAKATENVTGYKNGPAQYPWVPIKLIFRIFPSCNQTIIKTEVSDDMLLIALFGGGGGGGVLHGFAGFLSAQVKPGSEILTNSSIYINLNASKKNFLGKHCGKNEQFHLLQQCFLCILYLQILS